MPVHSSTLFYILRKGLFFPTIKFFSLITDSFSRIDYFSILKSLKSAKKVETLFSISNELEPSFRWRIEKDDVIFTQ